MIWTSLVPHLEAIITVTAICLNIIQYFRRELENKSLRSQMQMQYNIHYLVARVCTRIRVIKEDKTTPTEESLSNIYNEVSIIRGIVDSARTSLVSYSRERLKFTPFFEHPAFPGKEAPDSVKFGDLPENHLSDY